MNVFHIYYLGNLYFSIRTSNGIELTTARRFDDISDLQDWVTKFCSSWNNASIIYFIDDFKKEQNYV